MVVMLAGQLCVATWCISLWFVRGVPGRALLVAHGRHEALAATEIIAHESVTLPLPGASHALATDGVIGINSIQLDTCFQNGMECTTAVEGHYRLLILTTVSGPERYDPVDRDGEAPYVP